MKLINRKEISEKSGRSIHTVNKYVSAGIFVPHDKDPKDNRTDLFYDMCVDIENHFCSELMGKKRKNKIETGKILRIVFGEENENLIKKINNHNNKSDVIKFFEKRVLNKS